MSADSDGMSPGQVGMNPGRDGRSRAQDALTVTPASTSSRPRTGAPGPTRGSSGRVLFPIGHYAGAAPPTRGLLRVSRDAGAPLHCSPQASPGGPSQTSTDPMQTSTDDMEHLIRVGRRLEVLTEDEFGVWVLAHGLPENLSRQADAVDDLSWTPADVLRHAGDAEVADPERCLSDLLERGLLVEVPTTPDRVDEAVTFATSHRVGALQVGLGRIPETPGGPVGGAYAVGLTGVGVTALLDERCYRLWLWGGTSGSLWRYCEERVRSTSGALESFVDPGRLLLETLAALRILLLHGCAFLDRVPIDGVRVEPE